MLFLKEMHRSGFVTLAKKGCKQGARFGTIPKKDGGGAVRVIPREIGLVAIKVVLNAYIFESSQSKDHRG